MLVPSYYAGCKNSTVVIGYRNASTDDTVVPRRHDELSEAAASFLIDVDRAPMED